MKPRLRGRAWMLEECDAIYAALIAHESLIQQIDPLSEDYEARCMAAHAVIDHLRQRVAAVRQSLVVH